MDSIINLDNKSTIHLSASKTISTYLIDKEIQKEKEIKKKAAADALIKTKKTNSKVISKTLTQRKTINFSTKNSKGLNLNNLTINKK